MKEVPNKCDCKECDVREMFYEHVEEQHIEFVCVTKIEKVFKKGDVIIEAGKPIENFIYLKSGLVKLYKHDENEKGQIIMIAKPFDFYFK